MAILSRYPPNLNHSDNPYACFPIPDPLRIRSHPFEVFIFALLCGFSIRVLSHSFVNLHLRLFVYIRRYFHSRVFASIRGYLHSSVFASICGYSHSCVFASIRGYSHLRVFASIRGYLHSRAFVSIRGYFHSRVFASIRGLPTLNPQQYLIHRVQ